MSERFLSTALMGVVFLLVLSQPRLYEKNLGTALLLGCALVLQEAQSLAVVRSLVLALLQGEACHRALTNLDIASSNVVWVTIFALLQDNLVGIARLVTALALVSYSANAIWTRTLSEALLMRTQRAYWHVGDEEDDDGEEESEQPGRFRTEWGAILQLMITKRAYDMLSQRLRSTQEIEEAKRQFLAAPLNDVHARDRFTMAVFSAMSKQGTITVIRSAENSQVRRFASQAAAFMERQFTQTALGRIETVFFPLPHVIDPAEQSGIRTTILLLATLAGHKKIFQHVKWNYYNGKTPLYLFLVKQISRAFLVIYLLARFSLGYLKRPPILISPPPSTQRSHGVPPPDFNSPPIQSGSQQPLTIPRLALDAATPIAPQQSDSEEREAPDELLVENEEEGVVVEIEDDMIQ